MIKPLEAVARWVSRPFRASTDRQNRLAAERAEIGRNDRCYCGSGKKYKNCHLAEDEKRGRGAQLSQEQMMRQASDSVSGPQRKKKP